MRRDLSRALVFNDTWTTRNHAPTGMGDLAALVWHAICAWHNPLETPDEIARTRELLRYSYVLALANVIESDGHQVCTTGVSQLVVTTLQGHYGIKLDLVTPQALLTELAREFAIVQNGQNPDEELLAAFFQNVTQQAELYFHGEPDSIAIFRVHLQAYLLLLA